ncbi:MAG: phosphoribosylformylglycinamidine synthase II, partial [Bacilli bacterium]
DVTLYSESQSRIVLSVTEGNVDAVKTKIEQANVPYQEIGIVSGKNVSIQINEQLVTDVPVTSLTAAWKGAIPWLMKKKSLTS